MITEVVSRYFASLTSFNNGMDIRVFFRGDLVGSRGGTCRGAFLEESRILCCARFPFIRAAMRLPNWGRSWKLLGREKYVG